MKYLDFILGIGSIYILFKKNILLGDYFLEGINIVLPVKEDKAIESKTK
jgi:hypothetical protein